MTVLSNLDFSVYFVADPQACARRRVDDVVDRACKGGATMVQYRDKSGSKEIAYHTACFVRDVAFDHSVPFIVNDHLDIAYDIYADGVHLGQTDGSPMRARELLGPDGIVGVTAYTEEQLLALDPSIVTYAGVGPFFETKTDKGKPVLGSERFAELVEISPVPVVGIGGITAENCGEVIRAGADGVAMMRSISEADEPDVAAEHIVKAVRAAKQHL